MNERLKLLRKTLKLSQDAFAERIGMKGSSISLLESGGRNITEQVIKSICREFNVDYIWLTTGDGEMFVDTDDDFIERIDRIMVGEDDARKNLFKALLEASDEDIAAFQRIIDLFASKKDQASTSWFLPDLSDILCIGCDMICKADIHNPLLCVQSVISRCIRLDSGSAISRNLHTYLRCRILLPSQALSLLFPVHNSILRYRQVFSV